MKTKIFSVSLIVMAFILSACAAPTPDASQNGAQDSGQNASQNGGQNGGPGSGQANTLESRLAMGTLKLEGSSQAVTADQAKQLLPLWQQVKTLSANTATSQTDLQAVYQNIEKVMTSDQIKTVQNMALSQTDMQDLIKSLGITPPAGGAGGQGRPDNGTPFPTMSADQRATRQAQRTLTPGSSAAGGGLGGRGGFGFNRIFIDPLIKVLQTRAGG